MQNSRHNRTLSAQKYFPFPIPSLHDAKVWCTGCAKHVIVDLLNYADAVEVVVSLQPMPWAIIFGSPVTSGSRSQCVLAIFEDGTISEASPWGARLIDYKPSVITTLLLVLTFV